MAPTPLQAVDFIKHNGRTASGLVPIKSEFNTSLSVSEQAAVFNAGTFEHITYIFFRRFSDGRSSQIAAYVIDNTYERLNENELAELHLQVWLQGAAPLLYIAWPSRIDVLTCARGPDFWQTNNNECRYSPVKNFDLEKLKTVGKITDDLQKFSALRLADGTFWEEPSNAALANHSLAAHQSLIQAIVEADKDLEGEKNPVLRRLLLLMVLIKYLEDRRVFPNQGWFGSFHKGAKTFFDVLKGKEPDEVYRLLDLLERKFNGDIFILPENGRQTLTPKMLSRFADLVEAKTLSRQLYLWKQFSFEHLPVEIISHLYQRFVQGHGAVYTPPFLASLLLDHAMPYTKLTGKERVLDPACGSGVFLVGAFRRLINYWRSQNSWKRPDVDTLKKILKNSIYGVELDSNAIDLTAFSLSLAICDALQPEVIWRDLKFDCLKESNLFKTDFFNFFTNVQGQQDGIVANGFNIAIGNPPFLSSLSDAGIAVNKRAQEQDKNRGALPDNQMAYLFLETIFNLVAPGGRACLIQPSGLLYNRKAHTFQNNLFSKYKVDTVLDFTSIRNLYEKDPKTIAVSAFAIQPPKDHQISHWIFRRTVSVHERICFELDHYDRHRVSQKQVESDAFVWRTNLLGGGRLHSISQRLRKMPKLSDYISQQDDWDYGEGFIAGKKGKREPAPFLTGQPLLPTDAFTDSGIDETQLKIVEDTFFKSAYTENRYSAPLILIKEMDSLPIAFWNNGFIAYRDKIIGIHAPKDQSAKLKKIYTSLANNKTVYRFCCALNGSQALVGKATAILKQDIDLLPYPEDIKEIELSFWEKALCDDVLNYMTTYIRLGQNSELLKNAATADNLKKYSDIFLRMLGSIYKSLKASDPLFLNGLTCQPFYFGERPNLSWLLEHPEKELQRIIYDDRKHKHLRTVRILRLYSENVLLLIKPDRLRYWIPSTAIYDADETLVDLRRQGY